MSQILTLNWWFSLFGEIAPWWFACAFLGTLALPLSLRLFRGLADRGASLAIGLGPVLVTTFAWMMALPITGLMMKGATMRVALLTAASAWVAGVILYSKDRESKPARFFPALLLAVLGVLPLPHNTFGVLVACLLLGACSLAAWAGDFGRLRREVRRCLTPFLLSQLIFFVAFLFFANVRSYLPWATFDRSLWQAEKMGNLMHLNSVMNSVAMPPADAWYSGEPTNYYYGGHLFVATIAKLTRTAPEIAFNLGLATIFALTASLGFGLVYNAVHRVPRIGTVGGLRWHHGMAWGVFGALAIATFGNLDAIQQLATRDPESARSRAELRIELEQLRQFSERPQEALDSYLERQRAIDMMLIDADRAAQAARAKWDAKRNAADSSREESLPRAEKEGDAERLRSDDAAAAEDIANRMKQLRDEVVELSIPEAFQRIYGMVSKPTTEQLRWAPENFLEVDFWRSSRAIKGTPPGDKTAGTITEFPYFSAILGDLHPHHMALPYALLALAATLAFLRRAGRPRAETDRQWFARCWVQLLAMGYFIGAVFSVNIWDAVVLSLLYAGAILVARRDVKACECWRWVGFAGAFLALVWVVTFVMNSRAGAVPVFSSPALFGAGFAAMFGVAILGTTLLRRVPKAVVLFAAIVLGSIAAMWSGSAGAERMFANLGSLPDGASPGAIAQRDGIVFFVLAVLAAWWTLHKPAPRHLWWYSAGAVYAIAGGVALFVSQPFRAFFISPLAPTRRILDSVFPPRLSQDLVEAKGDFWVRFWQGSPVNPFPGELRTDLRDYFVHWGLFLFPFVVFFLARQVRLRETIGRARYFGLLMLMAFLGALGINFMDKWLGPLALMLTASCFFAAIAFRRAEEGPAWLFMAVAFFWSWFCEALHFDDSYGGNLERYNTPFKIYYPLWAMFAVGAAVALRELGARARVTVSTPLRTLASGPMVTLAILVAAAMYAAHSLFEAKLRTLVLVAILLVVLTVRLFTARNAASHTAGWFSRLFAHAPAGLAALLLLVLGLYYPLAATATRTRGLFEQQAQIREHTTLNALVNGILTPDSVSGAGNEAGDPKSIKFKDWLTGKRPTFSEEQRKRLAIRVTSNMLSRGFGGDRSEDFYTVRTLDATKWLDQDFRYMGDRQIASWLRENWRAEDGFILEYRRGDGGAYADTGRIAAMTGIPTVIGWDHHQNQWRGWGGKALPAHLALKPQYFELFSKRDIPELLDEWNAELRRFIAKYDAATKETRLETAKTIVRLALESPKELRRMLEKLAPTGEARPDTAEFNDLTIKLVQSTRKKFSSGRLTDLLVERSRLLYDSPRMTPDLVESLRNLRVGYVIVGAVELSQVTPQMLAKFDDPENAQLFKKVAEFKVEAAQPQHGGREPLPVQRTCRIYKVTLPPAAPAMDSTAEAGS